MRAMLFERAGRSLTPIRTNVRTFALDQASQALDSLRGGEIEGSAALSIAG